MHSLFTHIVLLLGALTLPLSGYAAETPDAPKIAPKIPQAKFGFNYWPYQQHAGVLIGANWNAATKRQLRADLDLMASLGAEMVRVMIWPYDDISGWKQLPDGKGSELTANYQSFLKNLPELLAEYKARKISVSIAFGDNWFHKSAANKPGLWRSSYSDDLPRYLKDVAKWETGIMNAAETAAGDNIVYYDIHNEASIYWDPLMWDYLKLVGNDINWPKGKLGLSTMLQGQGCGGRNDNPQVLAALADKKLDFIEFHSYPTGCTPDYKRALIQQKAAFVGTKVVMGEFGFRSKSASDEKAQAEWLANAFEWIKTSGDLYAALHWTFYDELGKWKDQNIGIAYSPHKPKAAQEVVADYFSQVANPGFEKKGQKSTQPAESWTSGSQGVEVISEWIQDETRAASRKAFVRLKVNKGSTGTIILTSDKIKVNPGASMVFANAYVRGKVISARLEIEEFDAKGSVLARTKWPSGIPVETEWRNYLHLAGPHSQKLSAETRSLALVIAAEVNGPDSFLDMDTTSLHAR